MALTRKFLRQFGSTAAGAVNGLNQFGSFAAGAVNYTTDPLSIQSLGAWLSGWASAIVGAGDPVLEDWNAVCYVFCYQLCYLMQSGVPEWDATTDYFVNSIVRSGDGLFVSLFGTPGVSTNTNNAVTDATKWKRYGCGLTSYAGDQAIVGTEEVIEWTAGGADCTATLPAASAALTGKKIVITKVDLTASAVLITDGSYAGQLNALFDSKTLFCNGAIWYAI